MSAPVEEWVATVQLSSFGARRKMLVDVAGEPVSLFKVGPDVFAFHDICIHQERSLFKGTILHGAVICPGHQWKFDLETGYAEDQDECQPTYETKIVDGTVFVSATPRKQTI